MSSATPPPQGAADDGAHTPSETVFDKGLQPERTLLAWRRTCLAFGVASLVGMRFTVDALGLLAVFAGVIGGGLAVLAYVLAATGYRRAHESLRGRGVLSRDGLPMLAGTASALVIGVLCAAYLVAGLLAA
ncbi:DUF202 domain-containing protein [Brachybacterium endophyticum]|uniref:DUF202 domain-containing protein n=1 Tax=Brachybacterium endophyticum TaxID=2182385 RepID=A0A2U2RKD1_9MICO|nr:DUF202 domain-containing protein [Brachybacterium endophyticum]PWH06327.1 DUF202 domain-containing protein [Brachybacterium endophyticum]